MKNPFKSFLNFIAKKFKDDPSGMLIVTGVAGWALSSLAQISAVVLNPKLSKEQKSFLIPQEFADAAVNIGGFFLITRFAKSAVSNLFKTGKFAPSTVRKHFNNNKDFYEKKIGKIDFDLDKECNRAKFFPKQEYDVCKNFYTTMATVGGGILSSNVITPIIRNKMASNMQKTYIDNKETSAVEKPKLTTRLPKNSGLRI